MELLKKEKEISKEICKILNSVLIYLSQIWV